MPQAATPALTPSTPAALPTSGGGPVAADQLVPVLQSLVGALEGLVAALQGGATIGGGAATAAMPVAGGAMGAPTAAAAQAHAGAGHAHGARHGAGGTHKGHHGMKIIGRGAPDDPARAQQNLTAVYQTFSRHTRAGLDFRHNQTHGYLPKAERDAFRRQNPGLPVPQSLVFQEGSNRPIGAVYRNNEGPFDLGMGSRHTHADNPKSEMQHIWFTPDHLQFAFSDVEHGMTGGTAAAMKRLGYPVR